MLGSVLTDLKEGTFMVGTMVWFKAKSGCLKFVDSLYQEYLPNFPLQNLMLVWTTLGTWEGWSRSWVEKIGKQNVYLEHLKRFFPS